MARNNRRGVVVISDEPAMKHTRPIPRLVNDPDSRLHRKLEDIILLLGSIWREIQEQGRKVPVRGRQGAKKGR